MSSPGKSERAGAYHRYHIDVKQAPEIIPWPTRFRVHVGKVGLAKHLITELIHTRFDLPVVTSRPCMYGVYSGPVGGFWPRPELCVGCLRCTTEFPDFVTIEPNPDRLALGDSFFTSRQVDAVAYEAESGRVPVKGAGYRGRFGGEGWDGMWTDMSEIVRPTRDGIHGREFISTVVDIGEKPAYLRFDADGKTPLNPPRIVQLQVPFFFDRLHPGLQSFDLNRILIEAAEEIDSLALTPVDLILNHNLRSHAIVPLVTPTERESVRILPFRPKMIEMDGWDPALFQTIRQRWPETLVALRLGYPSGDELLQYVERGVRIFHLTADYHGRDTRGRFVFDAIREAHLALVDAHRRDEITLLGSGGITAAEHLPKAIIAGLDAVGLDTPLWVALQGRMQGEFTGRPDSQASLRMPDEIPLTWGTQRLKNLAAAWRDQLLEILGAMGLREVRRLRGEIGRALFQRDLEAEAFGEIEGYTV